MDYSKFSICILDDDDGSEIKGLERSYGPIIKDILSEVFYVWLSGKGREPVTWSTLIDCLKADDQLELVKDLMSMIEI